MRLLRVYCFSFQSSSFWNATFPSLIFIWHQTVLRLLRISASHYSKKNSKYIVPVRQTTMKTRLCFCATIFLWRNAIGLHCERRALGGLRQHGRVGSWSFFGYAWQLQPRDILSWEHFQTEAASLVFLSFFWDGRCYF